MWNGPGYNAAAMFRNYLILIPVVVLFAALVLLSLFLLALRKK